MDYFVTFLLCDFNFLVPGEGRMDVTIGLRAFDGSLVARSFHNTFPTCVTCVGMQAEGAAGEFRDGRLQLPSRTDVVYTNLPIQDVLACFASFSSLLGDASTHLEKDHSPCELAFSRCVGRPRFAYYGGFLRTPPSRRFS